MTSTKALPMKDWGPCMLQVTAVWLPWGLKVNSTVLVPTNGFRNSILIRMNSLGRLSRMVMTPAPTLLFPSQRKIAPVPEGEPSNEFFTEGSSLAQGDQACH